MMMRRSVSFLARYWLLSGLWVGGLRQKSRRSVGNGVFCVYVCNVSLCSQGRTPVWRANGISQRQKQIYWFPKKKRGFPLGDRCFLSFFFGFLGNCIPSFIVAFSLSTKVMNA